MMAKLMKRSIRSVGRSRGLTCNCTQKINIYLGQINACLHGLKLNYTKTNFMAFPLRANGHIENLMAHSNDYQLIPERLTNKFNCECPIIKQVTGVKYLGVMIDQNLN